MRNKLGGMSHKNCITHLPNPSLEIPVYFYNPYKRAVSIYQPKKKISKGIKLMI